MKLSVEILAPKKPWHPVAKRRERSTCGIATDASKTRLCERVKGPNVSAKKMTMMYIAPMKRGMSLATNFTTSWSKAREDKRWIVKEGYLARSCDEQSEQQTRGCS